LPLNDFHTVNIRYLTAAAAAVTSSTAMLLQQ